MKKKALGLLLGTILAMSLFWLMGYAMGGADNTGLRFQVTALQQELADCEEGWQTWDTFHRSEITDEEALIKVMESFAEVQSANITIDTPDTHFHIEWER